MTYFFSFGLLGLLIGNLIGLTAQSVVTAVVPLVFAFGGGSILAFLGKLPEQDRRLAIIAVAAMSLFCLIGVYSGIVISEYQLLSPRQPGVEGRPSGSWVTVAERKYLREQLLPEIQQIEQLVAQGRITEAEGYREVVKALNTKE